MCGRTESLQKPRVAPEGMNLLEQETRDDFEQASFYPRGEAQPKTVKTARQVP